jgi:hypothetical protein
VRRRPRLAAAALGVTLLAVAACRSPSPSAAELDCGRATVAVLDVLQRGITSGDRLTEGFEITAGPNTFVSAERTKPGKDGDHDILTWVLVGADPPRFESVDSFARTETTWPTSDLRVSTGGAMDSRVCTYDAYNRAQRARKSG